MYNTIKNFINTHNLIKQNDIIIIGLSGGPDSVFLLHMLMHIKKDYNLTLIAAHVNHEWRNEAHDEENMCQTIAQEHNIPFVSTKISTLSHPFKQQGSREEYARKIRRFFLEKVLHEYNGHHIALGHHAQDQQETFFIRLIRGTSLTGLTGIKPIHGHYIRPLLETNKQDILTWLIKHNIRYALDVSNESPLYLRNRIRTQVLPALHECDTRFDTNFLSTLHQLKQDDDYLTKIARKMFDEITEITENQRKININKFFSIDSVLHYRLILHWLIIEKVSFNPTKTFFDEIIRFLKNPQGGKHIMHTSWYILKKRDLVSIVKHSFF